MEKQSPDNYHGWADLVYRLLQEKKPFSERFIFIFLILGCLLVWAWIFIQDNQAGLLTTGIGFKWFVVKGLAFTVLTITAAIMIFLVLWLTKPKNG
jgi:hypothetical protein